MNTNQFRTILQRLTDGCSAELRLQTPEGVFTRRFRPESRLLILGGGHIALPLSQIGALLGYAVTVVDDRPEFASFSRFPAAADVICDSFSAALARLAPRPEDSVCIVTRGHRWDAECLRAVLSGPMPAYVGMIGSRRRVAMLMEQLTAEGFPAERLARVHAPIGLKIGAVTTAEIAVAIGAELVQERRAAPSADGPEVLEQTNTDMALLRFLADPAEEKALLAVLAAEGSTPAKPGAMMAVGRIGNGVGTIGGGCGEAAALARARRLIGTGGSCVMQVDLTNDDAARQGMVCGGTMQVFLADVSGEGSAE